MAKKTMANVPESVAVRQRGAFDFIGTYDNLCALQSTVPLVYVKARVKEGLLDINGDRVRMIDWSPILNAIKINKNLRYIALRSYFQHSSAGTNAKKSHYFKRRTPAICFKDVTLLAARSLASCLCVTKALKCLDLQGVPLRKKDIEILTKGIAKNKTLTHVLLDYCQIADSGVAALCQSLKNHPSITHVSLAGCNITPVGAAVISKLVKHQSTQRYSDAWADGLRYRSPDLNCMAGIRRITLNSNPMIGDSGISAIADALKDDLWLKALDLQNCGLSVVGAKYLLTTMEHNRTLIVLDIRQNPMVDNNTLRSVLGRVLLNANERDEAAFPWIKEEPPKDPYKTKKHRQPRGHSHCKKSIIAKWSSPSEGVPCVLPAGHKGFVPWRTAVRASKHQLGLSDEEDDSDVLQLKILDDDSTDELNPKTSDRKPEINENVRALKIHLLDAQRRLIRSKENEEILNQKIMTLEVENSRLRKELNSTLENSKIKSQIEDEMLLESIDKSFNKFHEFLNMLSDMGLGSLVTAAGLDPTTPKQPFSVRSKSTTSHSKARLDKAYLDDEHNEEEKMFQSDAIVIEGTGKNKQKSDPKVRDQEESTDIHSVNSQT
uniref:Centrosomal protein of 78 kDa-like n=1 Tax=Phallusia mammillata TaxID=59560 RepID=A0A6F9D9P6_9ASCI|nr:centrosomal protein of 78 kDa-like [Phallusia mammillata]